MYEIKDSDQERIIEVRQVPPGNVQVDVSKDTVAVTLDGRDFLRIPVAGIVADASFWEVTENAREEGRLLKVTLEKDPQMPAAPPLDSTKKSGEQEAQMSLPPVPPRRTSPPPRHPTPNASNSNGGDYQGIGSNSRGTTPTPQSGGPPPVAAASPPPNPPDALTGNQQQQQQQQPRDTWHFQDLLSLESYTTLDRFILPVFRSISAWMFDKFYYRYPQLQERWFGWMIYFVFIWACLGLTRTVIDSVFLSSFEHQRYGTALYMFQKAFGLIFCGAWLSCLVQIKGLIGEHGICPASETLRDKERLPSLLRFINPLRNTDLIAFVCVGLASSVLFTLNILPCIMMLISCVFFLSVKNVGGVFFQLQFDSLLLESGFISVLMYMDPISWVFYDFAAGGTALAPRICMWLMWWLLFRLIFSSGVVKLMSKDPTWADCTALTYHYWSQPLPTWLGYYASTLLNRDVHRIFCFIHFVLELASPFLFMTNLGSSLGFWSVVALQAGIGLTGNYGHFNILTMVLAFTMLPDSSWPVSLQIASECYTYTPGFLLRAIRILWKPIALVSVYLFGMAVFAASLVPVTLLGRSHLSVGDYTEALLSFKVRAARCSIPLPQDGRLQNWLGVDNLSIVSLHRILSRFGIINSYGVFAVMTTSRREVVILGSNDQREWRAFELYHKPGENLGVPPGFVAPCHLPRLDWRLWFCQFRAPQSWIYRLAWKLLKGEHDVLCLFRVVPFKEPPKYIKMDFYEYRFTTPEEYRETGNYWKRAPKGPFLSIMTLNEFSEEGEPNL